MSLKLLLILFAMGVMAAHLPAEPSHRMVRRMRQIPVQPQDCAETIAWEDDDPLASNADWEEVIGRQNAAIDAMVARFRGLQTPSFRKLDDAQRELTQGKVQPLESVAKFAAFLDQPSYQRWSYLNGELGVTLGTVDLETMARAGAEAEFSMVYFDSEFRKLRFNLTNGFEYWIPSLNAADLEDIDVITAGKLAGAIFQVRTTQAPEFFLMNDEFLRFCDRLETEHPELSEIFQFEMKPGAFLPWRYDLVGQTWIYFRDRQEIEESLRMYASLTQRGLEAHNYLYSYLQAQNAPSRRRLINRLIQKQHHLNPRLVDILDSIPVPERWLF